MRQFTIIAKGIVRRITARDYEQASMTLNSWGRENEVQAYGRTEICPGSCWTDRYGLEGEAFQGRLSIMLGEMLGIGVLGFIWQQRRGHALVWRETANNIVFILSLKKKKPICLYHSSNQPL